MAAATRIGLAHGVRWPDISALALRRISLPAQVGR